MLNVQFDQVLPLWVRVDVEAMAMKVYSTFPEVLGLGQHHQMHFKLISGHSQGWTFTPL